MYLAGSKGPLLFCLHGGGYCGLTWALVAAALKSECALGHSFWQLAGQCPCQGPRGHGACLSAPWSTLNCCDDSWYAAGQHSLQPVLG